MKEKATKKKAQWPNVRLREYRKMGYVEEGILKQDRLRNGEFVDRLRMSILREEFDYEPKV